VGYNIKPGPLLCRIALLASDRPGGRLVRKTAAPILSAEVLCW